jgi:acyl-CoA synthetase (AMP-forming)/AMP-acid ligase II
MAVVAEWCRVLMSSVVGFSVVNRPDRAPGQRLWRGRVLVPPWGGVVPAVVETLTEQLLRQVRERWHQPAVIHTSDPGSLEAETSLTYGQLHDAAAALASRIHEGYPVGSRVLLLYPPGLDFVVAFVACQYAGVIAVPGPEPNGHRHRAQRLAGILAGSGSAAVLTDTATARDVRGWIESIGAALPVVVTDERIGGKAERPEGNAWRQLGEALVEPRADAVSVLQYTSGSTAAPRGTMISQRNLVSHSRRLMTLLGTDGPVSVGGWVPMFHDMGLVGHVVTPLLCGGTSVLMSPTSFVRRPGSWLRLVDRYGLYMSAAPNFAYEMCAARVSDEEIQRLDLSRWMVAINGSEPVQARSVEAFIRRFAAAGLRPETICPGYGLAEATLVVSIGWKGTAPAITPVEAEPITRHVLRPLEHPGSDSDAFVPRLVGTGPVVDLDVRIVDPRTRAVLPERTVGEIWVRGPTVAAGYWADPAATRETFAAVTADGEPGFLRTGDLGALHDGELYVTGRIKEVLVVFGRNLSPHDIEAEARSRYRSLDGLVGAAFTIPVPHEEVVLLHECRPGAGEDVHRLVSSLRLHISRFFGVSASVVLVPPRKIPRTTSGKVQRAAARQSFMDGTVRPVAVGLTALARRTAVGARYAADAVVAG